MEPIMVVEDLTKHYDGGGTAVAALDRLSLHVAEGEFLAVVGPSGCGKTTLLEILAGLRAPTSGTVRVGGSPVAGPRSEIGVVFQEESTFPWRTVRENVEFGLQMGGVARAERAERARRMIAVVGLDGFEDAYPHQLSGGMRQRVAIARTLVTEPSIVVMDEPFGALDEQTRLIIGGELRGIAARTGATVLLVTHSIQEAALLSDRVVVLSARPGRIKAVVESPLPSPRGASALLTPEFAAITQQLWSCLEEASLVDAGQPPARQ
ncbi:ABC transporter ATP-binding protein [Nocardiopsis coralliicola]